jgi:hypothetical protein
MYPHCRKQGLKQDLKGIQHTFKVIWNLWGIYGESMGNKEWGNIECIEIYSCLLVC